MIKRLIIPTILLSSAVMAKSTYKPLKSILLNNNKTISVNLKEIGNTSYTIREGDTIASVASSHHVTIKKLRKSNALSAKQQLVAGTKLNIPDQSIPLSQILAFINSAGPAIKEAQKHLGKKYVWGANGPKTFDCSGFTCYISNKNGIRLPRTSVRQAEVGKRVTKSKLKAGDLIFFDTSKTRKGVVNHVGIYIGNNKFIHASSGANKVVISSLNQGFYRQRFMWGRRISNNEKTFRYSLQNR
ncbi:MAG: LysM peptidoglycan-binding domain-containing C40 family peptidase [Campylobacterota bacterium]|nr:LysM peptidoglycan-binding domain-containing C40 family peptidase [Campylobacterota bacterium]